jgi:ribonuclease Z
MARVNAGGYTCIGESVAGVGTAMVVKELKICFDLGVLPPAALSTNNIFLSHAHTDHCGELFNYLAVRALERRNLATLFAPPAMAKDLANLLKEWQRFAASSFDYRIVQCYPNAPIPLKNQTTVTALELDHEPATVGYLVEETVQKLQPVHNTLPAYEIALRKKRGDNDLFYEQVRPLFAYLPDTLPEGLDALPDGAWQARVMAVEATFLDDRKPLEKVRKGKHIRLDDILERLERFTGEHLLLFHFSKIYTSEEVREIVTSRLPPEWVDRVKLFQ